MTSDLKFVQVHGPAKARKGNVRENLGVLYVYVGTCVYFWLTRAVLVCRYMLGLYFLFCFLPQESLLPGKEKQGNYKYITAHDDVNSRTKE